MIIKRFANTDRVVQATVELLAEHFRALADGPYAVMLSGGRTPLAAYRALARQRPATSANLHVFLSDERLVPYDSAENNYRQAEDLIRALGLPTGQALRVRTDLGLEEAALQYDRELRALLDGNGSITLGLLGLGADGHTASLFRKRHVEEGVGRYAMAVARDGETDRVSVTRDLLLRVGRIVFLATGP